MILTKEVKINNSKSKEHYKKLSYDVSTKYNVVKPYELPNCARTPIKVKCDICGNEKDLNYCVYYKNTNGLKEDYCCCKKCSNEKSKKRLQMKYGVDNVFQLKEIKDKSKNTLQEKYGVDHPMHSQEIKDKLIQTNIERYGVEYVQMNKEIRDKKENTNIIKYGFKSVLKNDEIIKKFKNTLQEKYGVDHPMHSQKKPLPKMKYGQNMAAKFLQEKFL